VNYQEIKNILLGFYALFPNNVSHEVLDVRAGVWYRTFKDCCPVFMDRAVKLLTVSQIGHFPTPADMQNALNTVELIERICIEQEAAARRSHQESQDE